MKRFFFKITSVLLCASMVCLPCLTNFAGAMDNVVYYVSGVSGSDNASGEESSPFQTIRKAVEEINTSGTKSATVSIEDSVAYSTASNSPNLIPKHSAVITYAGQTADSKWNYDQASPFLKGPTILKDVTLYENGNGNKWIVTCGNDLTFEGTIRHLPVNDLSSTITNVTGRNLEICMSQNAAVTGQGGTLSLSADSTQTCGKNTSGVYDNSLYYITVGNNAGETQNDTKIILDNSSVGAKIALAKGTLNGVNIVENAGILWALTYSSSAKLTSYLQIVSNNGRAISVPAGLTAPGGIWNLTAPATSGSRLDTTKTPGIFSVVGTKTAVATSSDGKTYYSNFDDGTLTVPAGTYTVKFVDMSEEDYINFNQDGSIEMLRSKALDLSTVPVPEQTGKMFVGWMNASGQTVKNGDTFSYGTVLTPKYVDFNTDSGGDFYSIGYQIRTGDPAAIRFGFKISQSLKNTLSDIGISYKYGSLIVPSSVLDGVDNSNSLFLNYQYGSFVYQYQPLVVNGIYSFNNTGYSTTNFPVEKNIFSDSPDGTVFTATVDKLGKYTDGEYETDYEGRAYLTYTDLNGVSRTTYSEPRHTSLFKVVKEALLQDASAADDASVYRLSKAARTYLQQIFDDCKNGYVAYGTTEVIQNSDPNYAVERVNDVNGNAMGLFIRKAPITAQGKFDDIHIIQITDMHINYTDEQDESSPVLMSTKQNRKWNANGVSVIAAKRAMQYANYFDQTVVTGDTLDYLSHGALQLMKRFVWDEDPGILCTLGNHELVQQMQGTVPESMSLDQRLQLLQDNWKNNILYDSKLVKNKVMCVVMDNSQENFLDGEMEKLAADIQTARKNGYILLLFFHEPISTGNPADQADKAIQVGDTSSAVYDFYNTIGNNPQKDTAATAAVYKLITSNADVIKGVFNGHLHNDFYNEIQASYTNSDGVKCSRVIPQYTLDGNPYDNYKGHVLNITVKSSDPS